MLVTALLIAGVVLLPLPALLLGVRGIGRFSGLNLSDPRDRTSVLVLLALRVLLLGLLLATTGLLLVALVAALVREVELHGMVHVLFVLDLLLASLVLLTFGGRDRRPARRRASPAPTSASGRG